MDKIWSILILCSLNFRKWLTNVRIQVILLLVSLMIYNYMEGVHYFSRSVHVPMTPWSMPFLLTTFNSLIIIMLGYIFLYCDAPFLDEQQPYIIIRSGRTVYIIAQILYVVTSSLAYAIFILIMTLLCSLPEMKFSLEWGKVFKTLALTNAGSQFNVILHTPESFMIRYSPLEAIGKQIMMLWLVGSFLGLLIFFLNLFFPRFIGVCSTSLLVFLDMFADFFQKTHGYSGNQIYYFSPVSWANLSILQKDSAEMFPPFWYVCCVLIIFIVFFIIMILFIFRKKAIEVLPQI